MDTKDFAKLETTAGHIFKNKDLLMQSVVHRSYLNENPGFRLGHNERLEFLGDAVLELVVTEYLYNHYSNPEGELTNWRAALVNSHLLSSVAEEIQLNECLFLSRGEAKDVGKARQYILANAMEALIGAIYLDGGWEAASFFISRKILSKLPYILEKKLYLDPKSKFQEIAQEKIGITPSYRVLEETGPDHAKSFMIGVYLNEDLVATGKGMSKQEAQIDAADNALKIKQWD